MRLLRAVPFLLLAGACSEDVEDPHDHDHDHDHGLVTTVELAFTPIAGGDVLTFTWADPEDDGDPLIDPVELPAGDYTLSVGFYNELEDPVEDVNPEIIEEGEEHQVFLTGSAVQSEATGDNPGALLLVAYDDADANGLPLGLTYTATTLQAGTGELELTLRHLPEQDGSATKTTGLADDVASGGFGSIGGDTDVSVLFDVTVN